MSRAEQRVAKTNPFTTGVVVGMGWGLALGFLDGLSVLLELPILPHLSDRLRALAYLVIWYGLVGAILCGLLGAVVCVGLQLLRRRAGRRRLVAFYSGVSSGLACLVAGQSSLHVSFGRFPDPGHVGITLMLIGLGSVVGLAAGIGVYGVICWFQGGRGFLRPLRWGVARTGVATVFLIGVVALAAVAAYRNHLRYWLVFQSRPSRQVATPEQPNVVLITIDSLRADHLGVYGYDPEISPNIDAMADRGVVFDQAIAQSSWTLPSAASFLTSIHPTAMGIHYQRSLAADLRIDEMRVTLAEALRRGGYRTGAYVANLVVTIERGFFQGFDTFACARNEGLAFDRGRLRTEPLMWVMCSSKARLLQPVCALFDQGHALLFDPQILSYAQGNRINQYVRDFLRSYRDERFFLWLFYMEPHINYDPAQPFRPLPPEITPEREQFLRTIDMWALSGEEIVRPVDVQALLALYDGEIADVDVLVGLVMDELERQRVIDRTVVIVMADHGEEFYEHGDFTHGHTLYDELVRVPLIISGPVVARPGRRVETQVRLLDLVPTVCEIAGVPAPEEAVGRSLVPFLQGQGMEELPAFSEVLHTTIFQKKSIRYDGYKLIYDVESEGVELYDVQADLYEQVDLADGQPEVVETMLADLKAWMVRSAQVAAKLPRQRPLSWTLDDETRQQLRDAGY